MTIRYCGYEIGREITEEQLKRLFEFIHKHYEPEELIMASQEELFIIAEANKDKWL